MKKIVIIGGGAAGMFAAITAAKSGNKVVLLEHTEHIGKKLLATGNGKCNFTNLKIEPGDYRGNHPSFVSSILNRCPASKTIAMFEDMGLIWKQVNGLVYPFSGQAATILELLRRELILSNIEVQTEVKISHIVSLNRKDVNERYRIKIETSKGTIKADRVILACGSKAYPKTGSDGSGYKLAEKLGHTIIKPLPSLVQLKAKGKYFKEIAGVRSECELRLYIQAQEGMPKMAASDRGEVQFTDYGISGIPTFQISRYAVRALEEKKEAVVRCDFIPMITEEELIQYFVRKIQKSNNLSMEVLMLGLLNKKLNYALLKAMGYSVSMSAKELSKKQIKSIGRQIKNWDITLSGYQSFEQGQICQGGVDTSELTENMESRKHKGIFFAGEIVDIDGPCGGYNLQWAWSSGYVAAISAGEDTKND